MLAAHSRHEEQTYGFWVCLCLNLCFVAYGMTGQSFITSQLNFGGDGQESRKRWRVLQTFQTPWRKHTTKKFNAYFYCVPYFSTLAHSKYIEKVKTQLFDTGKGKKPTQLVCQRTSWAVIHRNIQTSRDSRALYSNSRYLVCPTATSDARIPRAEKYCCTEHMTVLPCSGFDRERHEIHRQETFQQGVYASYQFLKRIHHCNANAS